MKVYSLFGDYIEDGELFLGVFESVEKAKAAADYLAENELNGNPEGGFYVLESELNAVGDQEYDLVVNDYYNPNAEN